tara:strand:+ start:1424 stop:1621 length:198 start_codon:yes stop_codon:yes gene_type:complete
VKWNYKKQCYEGSIKDNTLDSPWIKFGGCGGREQCMSCPGGINLMKRGWIKTYGEDTRFTEEESK